MIRVAFYTKDCQDLYCKCTEISNFKNESEARLRAFAFNEAYTIIMEW